MSSENKQWIFIVSVLFCLPVYIYFGYFLDRTNFFYLFSGFTFLFIIYVFQILNLKLISIKGLVISAVLLRLLFLFSEPTLSDDIFRFIWDGRLWNAGINPFSNPPDYFINNAIHISGIDEDLYQKLNSKHYFTIYPPFAQLIFYLSTSMTVENLWISTILIRFSIIIAELISVFTILKILVRLNLSGKRLALYALNPLVIIELSGNLHFEAWLIAFLLLSVLMILNNKLLLSAVFMALAVSTKLWPLMFLPLFFGKVKLPDLMKYYGLVGVIVIITFIPILNPELIGNLFSSIDLYFQKFEFNASVFYILRYFGFLWKDYDMVEVIGPTLGLFSFMGILFLAYYNRNRPITHLPSAMLLAFSIYMFLGTTIHPWYLCLPLALSIFGNYRFPMLWSFLVILSYFAYSQPDWQESYLLLSIEYILVFIFFILEIKYESGFTKKLLAFIS